MSKGKVNQFVDYTTTSGDTGQSDPTSIQPLLNGEDVIAADPAAGHGGVINRPLEHLRRRTEALREVMEDSLYLRDADRGLLLGGPGRVTWPGSTTAGGSGIPVLDNVLFLLPALTPGAAQAAPVPPVASVFGQITLKKADGNPGIVVSSLRRSYQAGDRINVTVVPDTPLSAKVLGEPARTIVLAAPQATTLTQAITALNALVAESTPLVSATLASGGASSDALQVPQAKQYMARNCDGEGHTITPANLASFFASNPTSSLAEGDTLCIQYAKMIDETGSLGGRRQSTPENSNTAIPAGAFFNSRVSPDKLPNAIPVCKVLSGRLVFLSGAQVPAGVTNHDLAGAVGALVSYAGGAPWLDGTTNPATTVEAQLDKLVNDLINQAAATSGADKLGVGATTYSFGARPAESLKARIDAIAAAKANLLTPNTFTKPQTINTGSEDVVSSMLQSSVAPATLYKPVIQLQGVNGGQVRVYQKRDVNGIAITSNAQWDPTANVWRHDSDALAGSYLSIDQVSFSLRTRAPGAAAWADDAWTSVPLSHSLTPGHLTVLGALQGAAVVTAEPDIRHGDRTKNLLPLRIESGWTNQGGAVTAGQTVAAVFCDLPLAIGDRVKKVRLIYSVSGAAVGSQEIGASWYTTTAVVGQTAPGQTTIVPFTALTAGASGEIKALDLLPSTPVVVGANEKHVIHFVPPAPTTATKTIHRVEVVYDRP